MSGVDVYFWSRDKGVREGADYFLKQISRQSQAETVGFKIHFGEEGNTTHLKPEWLEGVGEYFQHPVFIDCNVLYKGSRTTRKQHLRVARRHGFGFIDLEILDGEYGEREVEVEVGSPETDKACLGGGIQDYGEIVSLAHFKGHMATGFGGALKNMGMGLGSRAGKLEMHSIVSPVVDEDKCIACGECIEHCPVDAISLQGGSARIDEDECIGCAHCIAFCTQGAVEIPWDMAEETNRVLMEKIADYGWAACQSRSCWYINFLTDITYDCDCLGKKQEPFMRDVGLVYGVDPVAVDKASLDLVREAYEGKPFLEKHGVDGAGILEYAEEMGYGSGSYNLIEV